MRCFAVTKAPIVRDDHPAMAAQQVTEIRWRLAEVEADGRDLVRWPALAGGASLTAAQAAILERGRNN
jgi:hypothetical protein